jgi:hypothetical protein
MGAGGSGGGDTGFGGGTPGDGGGEHLPGPAHWEANARDRLRVSCQAQYGGTCLSGHRGLRAALTCAAAECSAEMMLPGVSVGVSPGVTKSGACSSTAAKPVADCCNCLADPPPDATPLVAGVAAPVTNSSASSSAAHGARPKRELAARHDEARILCDKRCACADAPGARAAGCASRAGAKPTPVEARSVVRRCLLRRPWRRRRLRRRGAP